MANVYWILVPVRNGLPLTKKAVKSFLNQDIGKVRVLMIENDTADGTRDWARTLYPQVVTIHKDPPFSVAESWNKGLSVLFGDEVNEYVLVCNNDVELRPDTYRLLVEDGGDFVTAVGNADPECIATLTPPANPPRSHPDFSCFLIRRGVWGKVGRFDEQFLGAYCEDLDYHMRMHQIEIDAHCIDLPFYHVKSATLNTLPPEEAAHLCKLADRNREYFKDKWGMDVWSPEYKEFFKPPSGGQ